MRFKLQLFAITAITFLNIVNVDIAVANAETIDMKITARELINFKKLMENYSEQYDELVQEINSGEIEFVRVKALRSFYPSTKYYTPFSESVIKRMTAFAFIADTEEDLTKSNEALSSYRELLSQHLVNFDVLSFALTLARADVKYGDELKLKEIRDLIIKDLTSLYNVGKTPERAYDIATYGEETFILEQLNAKVLKSEVYQVSRVFYNVHDIQTPDGEFAQIFMNVTEPLRKVKIRQMVREQEERRTIQ